MGMMYIQVICFSGLIATDVSLAPWIDDIDSRLVSWVDCCRLRVRILLFMCSLALVDLYILSLRLFTHRHIDFMDFNTHLDFDLRKSTNRYLQSNSESKS